MWYKSILVKTDLALLTWRAMLAHLDGVVISTQHLCVSDINSRCSKYSECKCIYLSRGRPVDCQFDS